jgi:H+/Cl- antiporter ClcA
MFMLNTIRVTLKNAFERIRNEEIKNNLLQAIPFWIASVITGLIAVLYTKLFAMAERIALLVFNFHSWMLFILTPVCFILSWWIVKRFAPYAKGSGIPQVMAAVELSTPKTHHLVHKLLNLKIIIVKVLSSLVMVAGGGAIGREGPTIQIAASVFGYINKILPPWIPKVARRNMLVTGAAAGLAAAFNTPLGGMVFAIEELTKTHFSYYKTAIFSAVIIAGLTAQGLLGPYLYLGYPVISGTSSLIVFAVILVAMLSGISGSVTSKVILAILRWTSAFKSNRQNLLFLMLCALVMAGIACFLNFGVMGSGKHLMQQVLFTQDKYVPWYLPFLRMLGPVLSFSTGGAGGVFAPALGAGASVGSLIAGWFDLSEANTNLLVLTGMVGFLTGVTRSPFTAAILVLEMTDRHSVIFYLILAAMASSLISVLIDKHSLYDHLKLQNIHDLLKEEEEEKTVSRV